MNIDPIKMAEASERLGIVGVLVLILCIAIPAAAWGIRFLYKEKAVAERLRREHAEECAEDRVTSAEAVGELKVEIAKLDTRLEVQDVNIKQQKEDFIAMHLAALDKVGRVDSRHS